MAEASDEQLLTLTEVSNRTGISMPTLQRYKKLYQDRLPTVGSGRTQRYKEEALPIFEELKKENMSKRGRPRKNESRRKAKAESTTSEVRAQAQSSDDAGDELLTLKQIEAETGISYPTLLRYVKTSLKRIPHEGSGRKRRYPHEAIDVFKTLREESRRGRRGKKGGTTASTSGASSSSARVAKADTSGLERQIRDLQAAHRELQRQVKQIEKELRKPLKVTVQRS